MDDMIRCANPDCRRFFLPHPCVRNQRYCGREECRRVRRRLWQREKMAGDPDYKANQRDSQEAWRGRNAGYWRRYRVCHPEYVERNRLLQRRRDRKRRVRNLAKMDSIKTVSLLESGTYHVIPESADLAKMDPLSWRFILIPAT